MVLGLEPPPLAAMSFEDKSQQYLESGYALGLLLPLLLILIVFSYSCSRPTIRTGIRFFVTVSCPERET